jgi:WD40 repeat protein
MSDDDDDDLFVDAAEYEEDLDERRLSRRSLNGKEERRRSKEKDELNKNGNGVKKTESLPLHGSSLPPVPLPATTDRLYSNVPPPQVDAVSTDPRKDKEGLVERKGSAPTGFTAAGDRKGSAFSPPAQGTIKPAPQRSDDGSRISSSTGTGTGAAITNFTVTSTSTPVDAAPLINASTIGEARDTISSSESYGVRSPANSTASLPSMKSGEVVKIPPMLGAASTSSTKSMKDIMEAGVGGETITAHMETVGEDIGVSEEAKDVSDVDKNTVIDKDTGRVLKITDEEEMTKIHDKYTTFSSSLFPNSAEEVKAARAKAEEEKVHEDEDVEDKIRGGMGKMMNFFTKKFGGAAPSADSKAKEEKKAENSTPSHTTATSVEKKHGSDDTTTTADGTIPIIVNKKDVKELNQLKQVQELHLHKESIWTMQFSADGKYLATAGLDTIVYVWIVHPKEVPYEKEKVEPTKTGTPRRSESEPFEERRVINPVPWRKYEGHRLHVVDLSWSKSNFLISASIDKTVRLFHVSRKECLYMFKHADMVTSVCFHPLDERFFLSGCFDKKLRIWNIPESRVVTWAQAPVMITAATFSPDGQLCVAGLFTGECVFYHTERLRYYTTVECKNRHGAYRSGRKVTGLSFRERDGSLQLLVTTNDSRIRLLNMDDFSTACKYKGLVNTQSQICASFSSDGYHVVCGSEDGSLYLWRTDSDLYIPSINPRFTGYRRDRNSSYECFRSCDNGMLTAALIAPQTTVEMVRNDGEGGRGTAAGKDIPRAGFIILTGSTDGIIKVYETFGEPVLI